MKKGNTIILTLVVIVAAFFIVRSCNNKTDVDRHGKSELKVQLQWFNGAQFCGLYVAEAKGYFKEENLVVDLIPVNSFTSDPVAILTDGDVDIAIATSDQVLINKDNGKEIKVIGTVFNRSMACYMYKSNAGINSLEDFRDKKIAVYKKFDTENILLAMFHKYNINPRDNNIEILQAGPIESFRMNEYDVLGSYMINEPIDMDLNNIDVKYLDPVDYGVKFYSDTYIVKFDTWNDRKDELVRFLRAANKGWKYAHDHPEESIDIMFDVVKNLTKDESGEKELRALKEAIKYLGEGEDNQYSRMDKNIWDGMEQNLRDIGRIKSTGYIDDLCDFEIIDDVYANE
jgi:ABC-type nitrate/sulfonate/bicarbonate transport system substrate-binding protein